MTTRRIEKANQAVKEVVSLQILHVLRDPRIGHVTVTKAEVAPDFKSAKVYVSVLGDRKKQSLTLHGLESARGHLQSKVADRLQSRNTPILRFVIDSALAKSQETQRILEQLREAGELEPIEDEDTEAAEEAEGDDAMTDVADADDTETAESGVPAEPEAAEPPPTS